METSLLNGLRPEHELLLALSRPRLAEAEQEHIREFLAAQETEIDWGEFIDQACRHMVLPIVGRHLTRLRLTHTRDGKLLVPYRWLYNDVYEGSRRRSLMLADEYGRVMRALNGAGLDYLIRKGPVLGERIYSDLAARRISNLDVFLRKADYPLFQEVAASLGYAMGELDASGSSIVPFDRRTQMYWKVTLTNTSLPYARTGDRDQVESYLLSGCFSLFQPMLGIANDAEDFLRSGVDTVLYGEPARMLHPAYQILDSCVQIHVRATMLYYIESRKDLLVRNFLDLVHLLGTASDDVLVELREAVAKYDCGRSVYYALHFALQLYPDLVPEDLMASFRPADLDYLDQYGAFDGDPHEWSQDFSERLFDNRRAEKVAVQSKVPGPRSRV